jgi:4'-phosphopantetheinyl transferase
VHIWRATLELPDTAVQNFRQLLSSDETTRADRYHFERDRRHFTVARGVLRSLLGRYLSLEPAELSFQYSHYGKPDVTFESPSDLKFNLAHSGGIALYAFTKLAEVGIDVEFIRAEFTGDEIARRYFSAGEVSALQTLGEVQRHQAFFDCWTRKEAFIKAKGMGLSLGLDQFDVTLTPHEEPALLCTRWNEAEARRWSIRAIEVGDNFKAAVAVQAHNWQAKLFEF